MSSKADLLHKLEWDPLFIASREALKMTREGFVTKDQIGRELKKYSQDLKDNQPGVLPSVERYKLNLINEAHLRISEGIFSVQDVENLKNYYGRDDMTIFATPRTLNPETEMAWAIVCPLVERLERWKKIEELIASGLIREDEIIAIKEIIVNGENFDKSLNNSVLFLDRMRYAKRKGILDEKGYPKALQLIPLMIKELMGEVEPSAVNMNSQEIMEGIEKGDQDSFQQEIMVEENGDIIGLEKQPDPLMEWRRLVYILIDAWQSILNTRLIDEFNELSTTVDLNLLQQTHYFLVHLNKEYVSDDRQEAVKKDDYLQKIGQYLSKIDTKIAVG